MQTTTLQGRNAFSGGITIIRKKFKFVKFF